ncbi:seryl-tRNA synthetase [Xylariomycetidae sp. FL0641]|nr:seryl-tRNA synthetase [Xylariomycetidae sp. FL0641]
MKALRAAFVCPQCRFIRPKPKTRFLHTTSVRRFATPSASVESSAFTQQQQRPTTAPKPTIDIKHIRQNPDLHAQNCLARNYRIQATYPERINALFAEWLARQRDGRSLRERRNILRRQLANPASIQHEDEQEKTGADTTQQSEGSDAYTTAEGGSKDIRTMTKDELLDEARQLKQQLSVIEADEARLETEMEELALALPNLTSEHTPPGDEPRILTYINEHPTSSKSTSSDRIWRSHVHIGSELGILDFASAATTSGWGWYYLLDEGAELEQALIQYALSAVARMPGWRRVAPPSIVYSHMAAACGFQPRDANGEQQIYSLTRSPADLARGRPELVLAGTAEIPLAALRADAVVPAAELPLKRVGVSRSYRAEAGARGVDTKGLYRVHEFSKVEMFGWCLPDEDSGTDLFDEVVDAQTEILQALGLRCRVLEMPTADLGASAQRKIDIEAFFPSRADRNEGWGEVSSASLCTDYQTRRLATRLRQSSAAGGETNNKFPWTVNGTAMAVPRVLAALLETGWNESTMTVAIPECLRPWMDGKETIGLRHRRK